MASEVNIVISATDKASGVLKGIGNVLEGLAKTAAGIAIASGVAFVALGKQALDATAEYERMSLTMESLVARELRAKDATLSMADALALAGEESKRLLGWIQDVAIKSPFDMASVQVAYRQALTYGFASDQAQKLTQNMVDFAAANGLTAEAMNTVSYALGQINNNDKVLMLDLRQLMQVGVPVLDILKEMGMSFEDVSDGAVKSADFIAKFNEVMERDFGGAAARQTKSWTGLINTLGDLKKLALRELFAGIFDELQPLVAKFAEWLQGDGLTVLKGWSDALGEMTRNLLGFFSSLSGRSFEGLANMAGDFWVNFSADLLQKVREIDWSGLSIALADKIDQIDWNLLGQKLGAGLRNVLALVSDIMTEIDWGALFSSAANAATEFFIGTLGLTMQELRRIVSNTMVGIRNDIVAAFGNMVVTIVSTVSGLIAILMAVGRSAGLTLMTNLANGIRAGLSSVLSVISQMVKAITGALSKIKIPLTGTTTSSSSGTGGTTKKKNLPEGADGGIMRGPKTGYPAILHGTEAVIPLDKAGGFGGVTVNVNISSFMSLADQAAAEMKLVPIIERAIRSARGVV